MWCPAMGPITPAGSFANRGEDRKLSLQRIVSSQGFVSAEMQMQQTLGRR